MAGILVSRTVKKVAAKKELASVFVLALTIATFIFERKGKKKRLKMGKYEKVKGYLVLVTSKGKPRIS